MIRNLIAASAAALALTLVAASGARADAESAADLFGVRETALLAMVNESVNESHLPGSHLPSDPDGIWDAGNYASAKYRALRDDFRWSPYRLAIGLVRLPDGRQHVVLLVKGFQGRDWGVLDHTTDEIVPLRSRERERWTVKFANFEPAASPAASWVMTARTTPPPLFR